MTAINHDTSTAATESTDAIPLLANSYNFGALEKASHHAANLKDPDKRNAALAKIAEEKALNQDVIEGRNSPAVPEGQKLAQTVDAQGREVTAPVLDTKADQPDAEEPAVEPDGPTRRRAPAPNAE
jgi:hypothetical protein